VEALKDRLASRKARLSAARSLMKAPSTEDDPFATAESQSSSSKTELWASAIAALDAEWSRVAQDTTDARQTLVRALLSIYKKRTSWSWTGRRFLKAVSVASRAPSCRR
jgi:hypothetical protein